MQHNNQYEPLQNHSQLPKSKNMNAYALFSKYINVIKENLDYKL